MKFKFVDISRSVFTEMVSNDRASIIWFVYIIQHQCEGITFQSIHSNSLTIGVCYLIEKIAKVEVGIFIKEEYRKQGYGFRVVESLVARSKVQLQFTVSRNNVPSLSFFQKLTEQGLLYVSQAGQNFVFTSVNY